MAEQTLTAPAVTESVDIVATLRTVTKRFAPYLRTNARVLWIAVFATVAFTLLGLFQMYTIMIGITYVVVGNVQAITVIVVELILIAITECVIRIVNAAALVRMNERMTVAIRRDLLNRLHRISLAQHDQQVSGVWMSKVLFEADRFREFFTSRLLGVVHSVAWFTGVAVFLLTISPAVTAPTLVAVPLMAWIAIRRVRRMQDEWQVQREAWDNVVGYMTQRLEGLSDIRAFGQETAMLTEFDELSERYRKIHTGLALRRVSLASFLEYCVYISLAMLIFFGGLRLEHHGSLGDGAFFKFATGLMPMTWMLVGTRPMMSVMGMAHGVALSAGALAAFVLFTKRMLTPIRDVAHQVGEFSDLKISTSRVLDILDLTEEDDSGVVLADVRGHIEITHVDFSYAPGVPVLHDISMEVRHGEHVAIVGPTGAGKSTLVQLLGRYYEPDAGTIHLDGHDIAGVSLTSLRGNVIVVAQEAQLFSGTVLDNIRFARPDAEDGEVMAAARAIGADEVIRALPRGYDTIVGERGGKLSVGERQLVALARAMLADRQVVVLDEAVSSVDAVRQRAVLTATRNLLAGRTAIVVAHWLELARDADRVVVLEEGRIVETGTPAELLAGPSRFAALWSAQNRPAADPATS